MTCPICADNYNQSTLVKVTCENPTCNFECCKTCIRTYVTSTTKDPHCMECKRQYTPEFLARNLNQTWLKKQYKQHRMQLLFEREIAQIPETMPRVEQYSKLQSLIEKDKEYISKIAELRQQLSQLQIEKGINLNNINTIRRGGIIAEKREFIMPCSDPDCRGFLNTSYKCAVCNMFTCSKCHEMLGKSKDNPDHVCDEEKVKSTELIKKDTKPCPSCGNRISKIGGCDQMWCPGCKHAFSWRTGQIDNGIIHNPHFYQWQQQAGAQAAPRNPGDVVCGGLPLWTAMMRNAPLLSPYFRRTIDKDDIKHMMIEELNDGKFIEEQFLKCHTIAVKLNSLMSYTQDIYRETGHIINVCLREIRDNVNHLQNNETLRIEYITKKLPEEKFKTYINQRDQKRKKNTEIMHIWELFTTIAIETFRNFETEMNEIHQSEKFRKKYEAVCRWKATRKITIYSPTFKNFITTMIEYQMPDFVSTLIGKVNEMITKLNSLREYCNHRFQIISATFGGQVAPNIKNDFSINSQKSTIKVFALDEPCINQMQNVKV